MICLTHRRTSLFGAVVLYIGATATSHAELDFEYPRRGVMRSAAFARAAVADCPGFHLRDDQLRDHIARISLRRQDVSDRYERTVERFMRYFARMKAAGLGQPACEGAYKLLGPGAADLISR